MRTLWLNLSSTKTLSGQLPGAYQTWRLGFFGFREPAVCEESCRADLRLAVGQEKCRARHDQAAVVPAYAKALRAFVAWFDELFSRLAQRRGIRAHLHVLLLSGLEQVAHRPGRWRTRRAVPGCGSAAGAVVFRRWHHEQRTRRYPQAPPFPPGRGQCPPLGAGAETGPGGIEGQRLYPRRACR